MTAPVVVRPALAKDKAEWLKLWQAYNDFYKTTVSNEVTESTWARIMQGNSIHCILATTQQDDMALGFINYVIHPRTWSIQDVCYLEDLYVHVHARGLGVGRILCEELKNVGKRQGLSRIYWNTQESNIAARTLYDQIATKDDFIRYIMPLEA